ncbi:MAG: type II secretion system F family protein, partial [Planctomycetota bacterium]|nr:type II secretion system F family protein [Planctomycetota bacterium]
MPRFSYTVAEGGERRLGVVEARDRSEAADLLRRRSLTILRLEPAAAAPVSSWWQRSAARFLTRQRRVEMALDQMAALLDAGVLAVNAIEGVAAQSPYFLGRALRQTAARIRRGQSLGESLSSEAPWLGEIVLGLIRVGEANGRLSEMLRYASQWLERSRRVRNRIIEALAYPAIVVILAMAVGYFLTSRVIPRIMEFIVKNRGSAALPSSTQLLMDISDAVRGYGHYGLALVALAAVAVALARRTEALGRPLDYLILRLPLLGPAFVSGITALWCRT